MFAGFGDVLKNLSSGAEDTAEEAKHGAEDLLERKKQELAELAEKKKQVAAELLEEQARKTGDLVWSTKADLEKLAVDEVQKMVTNAAAGKDSVKHKAIDALDELVKAEKATDNAINAAGSTVENKLKEADKILDEKRDNLAKGVADTTENVKESKDDAVSDLLDKAKGLFNF
ncbi:uncharacterized protein LOC134532949 [Bacillus rossius redtenbacheri]|uniref:uncharacterized protein LOC134532949 n=1 Tax=Bacillus rossius redtenbacheri TaxID=93214 RepID=UPI002FDE7E1F